MDAQCAPIRSMVGFYTQSIFIYLPFVMSIFRWLVTLMWNFSERNRQDLLSSHRVISVDRSIRVLLNEEAFLSATRDLGTTHRC